MKRIHYYIIGIFALLLLVIGGTWIGAYNGAVKKENAIFTEQGAIHASYVARYDKVAAMVNAITSANTQINGQISAITAARSSFVNMQDATAVEIQNAADSVEATINTLGIVLEDNPGQWNTIGLYNQYLAEFNASTNSIAFNINSYNATVQAYNTHIQLFPNNMFVGSRALYTLWPTPVSSTFANNLPVFE